MTPPTVRDWTFTNEDDLLTDSEDSLSTAEAKRHQKVRQAEEKEILMKMMRERRRRQKEEEREVR